MIMLYFSPIIQQLGDYSGEIHGHSSNSGEMPEGSLKCQYLCIRYGILYKTSWAELEKGQKEKRIKKDKLDPGNCMCSSKCHCLILECGSSAEGLWLVLRSLFFAGKIFRLIFPELNIQACVTVDLNQEHVIFLGY